MKYSFERKVLETVESGFVFSIWGNDRTIALGSYKSLGAGS